MKRETVTGATVTTEATVITGSDRETGATVKRTVITDSDNGSDSETGATVTLKMNRVIKQTEFFKKFLFLKN